MKQGKRRGGGAGEGWLLAAALGLILALSLGIWMNRQPRAERAAPVHFVDLAALERAAQVELNGASAAELAQLPGIGDVLAARIVAWRAENGPFSAIEELMNVPGIGEGKFSALKDRVRVS